MQKLFSTWMQTAIILGMVVLFGASTSFAQVTATVGDVTGRPGETATVAVELSGVEGSAAVQSFGFNVTAGAGITFAGTTTANSASGTAGFTVGHNTTNGNVGGFSTGTNITASGTLVYLNFTLDSASAGTFTLSGFTINGAAIAVDPSAGYTVSNRIIAVQSSSVGVGSKFDIMIDLEDALLSADGVVAFSIDLNYDPSLMSIDKTMGTNGAVNAGTLTSGATVDGNDVDANTYRLAGFTGTAITGSGTFIKVSATAASSAGMGAFTLSNVVFNGGTPIYASRSGALTVNAVNFPPVFTAELANTSILEDSGTFSTTYAATDANGDAITFALTAGPGAIDANTGVYTVNPMGMSGVHTVTVSASDGVNTTTTSATLTISRVDTFEFSMAGYNAVPATASVAGGTGMIRMVADTGVLELMMNGDNLSGDLTAGHIHFGGVGQNGGVALNLAPTSLNFNMTYDITGMTDLVSAMRAGTAYVNIHTSAYPAGEIRGQVLKAGNMAPSEATVRAPASVTVAGDPNDGAFTISWLPVSDPNGDTVNYIYQMAMDANYTQTVRIENFGATNGVSMSVGEAAMMYDMLTNAGPPNGVNVGGSVTVYHRVITTDGSRWNAGPTSSLTLTRGLVTDTEDEGQLPSEFALKGNYPNPFNPSTTISFDLPETADVSIQVVDLLGREMLTTPAQTFSAGASRSIQIDASSLTSGIYLYKVSVRGVSNSTVKVGTMTLLK